LSSAAISTPVGDNESVAASGVPDRALRQFQLRVAEPDAGVAGVAYSVQLQFVDLAWNNAGSRLFNMTINEPGVDQL
jgi:hypothetical protein